MATSASLAAQAPSPQGAAPGSGGAATAPAATPAQRYFIREYRVDGAKKLTRTEIENAVYPHLGPGRTQADIEAARQALEQAYQDKGYQTVSVQVPRQQMHHGVVVIQVTEMRVARLRVNGARYFAPEKLKKELPSVAPGKVIDFNKLADDMKSASRNPDRQITPSLELGTAPGTVNVNVAVKDKFPIHGSVELNNRFSADTEPLRLNASITDDNLWQLGHIFNFTFQVSPQDLSQVKVFSAYYFFYPQAVDWLGLTLQGTKQDSNVSTLGGIAVAGRGQTLGARANISLPSFGDYFQTLSLGIDWKHYHNATTVEGDPATAPKLPRRPAFTYYPVSVDYSGSWIGKTTETTFDISAALGLRDLGTRSQSFSDNRYNARENFFYLRGSLSHTRPLFWGMQAYGEVSWQVADVPLISNEQFAAGGMDTVRGYLEAEALGDDGLAATLELRSPDFASVAPQLNAWRVYTFFDTAHVLTIQPLPDEHSPIDLWSFGIGTRVRFLTHFNAIIDFAIPMTELIKTDAGDPRITFRTWADF